MSGPRTGTGTGTGRPSPLPPGFSSRSTPNLPTLRKLNTKSAEQKSKARDETAQHKSKARDGGKTARNEHSTPRLSIDGSMSPSTTLTCPSEAASLEDFSLDGNPPDLSVSDASEESDEDTLPDNLPAPATEALYARPHFSRSNTYLSSATFAPPFYNRPPTPLPPSPSLTSLLRPNFSAATSRPSTPDPSSDEGAGTTTTTTTTNLATGAQTPISAAATTLSSSFRTAKPIARASPKVPTYEYYGFTLYLTSFLVFLIYLLWSFLPSPFLHQLGIYYYPNRWWSLAIPAWLVMLVVWIFVALASFNTGYMTLPMREVGCLIDEKGSIAVVDRNGRLLRGEQSSWSATSAAMAPNGSNSTSEKKKKRAASKKRSDASGGGGKRDSLELAKDLDWRSLWNEGTDAVLDVPIGGVCEVLYGRPDGGDDECLDGF